MGTGPHCAHHLQISRSAAGLIARVLSISAQCTQVNISSEACSDTLLFPECGALSEVRSGGRQTKSESLRLIHKVGAPCKLQSPWP